MPGSGVEPLAGSSKRSISLVQTLYSYVKGIEVVFLL